MRRLTATWNRFWFAPVDARSVGVMRIGLALILVLNQIALWPRLDLLLGPDGAVPLDVSIAAGVRWRFSVYDYATTTVRLHAIHAVGLAAMVALLLGARTRLASLISLLFVVSLLHRNRWMLDGGDRLLRVMMLYLCLVPAGAALSLDALRTRHRARLGGEAPLSPLVPRLLQRLVQLQLMWMYLHAGIDKLNGGEWRAGTAVFYTLSDTALQGVQPITDFMLDTAAGQAFTTLGTYTSMGWELSFWLLVLWRPTRALALVIGLLFHLQIGLLMGIDTFSWTAMWGYLAFVRPDRLGALAGRAAGGFQHALTGS